MINKYSFGYTLIELLIVLSLLAIIIAAVIAGVDPVDRVAQANDARVQVDIEKIASAFERNVVTYGGVYSSNLDFLVAVGDLKSIPIPPNNYCGTYQTGAGGGSQFVWCNLKSKRYSATPYWYWCSVTGEAHAVSVIPSCP